MQIDRIWKYYTLRFKRLKGDPRSLAGGTALGVFVGLTPTIPFHTLIIILLALVTRTSTIAGILSSWFICNPLTYFPIYYLSLVIGNSVTPYELNWLKIKETLDLILAAEDLRQSIHTLFSLGFEAAIVMVVGGCLFALPFSIASYYLSLKFFVAIRKKRQDKHILH